jgi:hypothetical protein
MLRIYLTGINILIYKIFLARVLNVKDSFSNLASLIRCDFYSLSSFPVLYLVYDLGILTLSIKISISVKSIFLDL